MLSPGDIDAALAGFALGCASIFSIGPQNLQLIERGAVRDYPWTASCTGYGLELALVLGSLAGAGALIQSGIAQTPLHVAAVIFLAACGLRTLAKTRTAGAKQGAARLGSRRKAVTAMLGVTLLNPLVYVEIVLQGGVMASSYGAAAFLFTAGFLLASLLRFVGLPAFGLVLARRLSDARMRLAFQRVCGVLLIAVAAGQAARLV